MTIVYTLLIMFLFARLIIRCSSRKSYILTGLIVSIAVMLTDLRSIINNPKHYFIYDFWQILVAFIIFLVYALTNTTSIRRNRAFNKKLRTKTKPYFNTQKANGMYLIIASFLILIVGVVLLIIRLTEVYEEIPYVVFIGSAIGFIVLLIAGIVYIKKSVEKFILLVRTEEEFYTFFVNIVNKYKFNYMEYIGDIYRYYIIEKLGIIKYSGDLKETHYVWILDTENLNNYDISKLDMKKLDNSLYNKLINGIYKCRNVRINIKVENDEIKEMK